MDKLNMAPLPLKYSSKKSAMQFHVILVLQAVYTRLRFWEVFYKLVPVAHTVLSLINSKTWLIN